MDILFDDVAALASIMDRSEFFGRVPA